MQDIVVRVCFILGNLSSDNADTRDLLFSRHSALPILNEVFDRYLALERQLQVLRVDHEYFVLKNVLFWLNLSFMAEDPCHDNSYTQMNINFHCCANRESLKKIS